MNTFLARTEVIQPSNSHYHVVVLNLWGLDLPLRKIVAIIADLDAILLSELSMCI